MSINAQALVAAGAEVVAFDPGKRDLRQRTSHTLPEGVHLSRGVERQRLTINRRIAGRKGLLGRTVVMSVVLQLLAMLLPQR